MRNRVLVVDTDRSTGAVLDALLDRDRFAVTTADDGVAALAALAADPPEAVVCEVAVLFVGGLELCRRIKEDPRTSGVAVILLTGRDGSEDRERGFTAGCDAYLTKPFSPLHLLAVLAELCVVPDRR